MIPSTPSTLLDVWIRRGWKEGEEKVVKNKQVSEKIYFFSFEFDIGH